MHQASRFTFRVTFAGLLAVIMIASLCFSIVTANGYEENTNVANFTEELYPHLMSRKVKVSSPLIVEQELKPEPEEVKEEKPFIIDISEDEIDMLVQAVQHEVGNNPNYFPGYDFDFIQQCMAKVIVNRVGKASFADTVREVLAMPNHFMPEENLVYFDKDDELTRKNVFTVLYGEDEIPEDLVFEMSFLTSNLKYNLQVMEEQVGQVYVYHTAVSADQRFLIFSGMAC